jgi:hypothetical protein
MKRFLFVAILFILTSSLATPVLAQCVQQFPPGDGGKEPGATITSQDGNVSIGVSQRYGGAITYLRDSRLGRDGTAPDFGNLVDYGQGGAMFTTAIWTLPPSTQEQNLCWPQQKSDGVCPGSLPFNNPTQGGYLQDGCAGNPNTTTITKNGNRISTSYRLVNYNYAWNNPNTPLSDTNKAQWQTDFYGDMDLYFHPTIPDVIVIDTKMTYCKQGGCAPITTQDNQLSTFFGLGSQNADANFRGPLGRSIFRSTQPNYREIYALNDYSNPNSEHMLGVSLNYSKYSSIAQKFLDLGFNTENWGAMLYKNEDKGVGYTILNYAGVEPVFPYHNGGWGPTNYSSGPHPALTATGPQLDKFETNNIEKRIAGTGDLLDITKYRFQPGSWYKFRTFVSTGNIDKIRSDLIRAQDPNYLESRAVPVDAKITGFADVMNCSVVQGWTKHDDNPGLRLTAKADIYPDGEYASKITRQVTANGVRSDLGGVCSGGGCAYSISVGDLPTSFNGKQLHVDVYGAKTNGSGVIDGQARLNFSVSHIIGPCTAVTISATPTTLLGDINNDGTVNIADFITLITHMGDTNFASGDINGNGKIEIFDYASIIYNFGKP